MAKQTVNLGTMADNKSGDPLRTAFTKINENFDELYAQTGSGVGVNVGDQTTEPSQVTDIVFDGATVENVDGVSTVTIPSDISDFTDNTNILNQNQIGNLAINDNTITGQVLGQVGHQLTIATNYNGDTPAINGNGIQVSDNIPNINLVVAGWVIELADGHSETVTAAYASTQQAGTRIIGWDTSYNSNSASIYPLTITSPDYQAGEPANVTLQAGANQVTLNDKGHLELPATGTVKSQATNIVSTNFSQLQWVDGDGYDAVDPNQVQGFNSNWAYVDDSGFHIENNIGTPRSKAIDFENDGGLKYPDGTKQFTAYNDGNRAWFAVFGDGNNAIPSWEDNNTGNLWFDITCALPDNTVMVGGGWGWGDHPVLAQYNKDGKLLWQWMCAFDEYQGEVSSIAYNPNDQRIRVAITSDVGRNYWGTRLVYFSKNSNPTNFADVWVVDNAAALYDTNDDGDVYVTSSTFVNGGWVGVGQKSGNIIMSGTVAPAGGSGWQKLLINKSDLGQVNGKWPRQNGGWSLRSTHDGGNMFNGNDISYLVGRFIDVPFTVTTGNGVGGRLDISIDYNTNQYVVDASLWGEGYAVGDTITILGSNVNGVDTVNDIVLTVIQSDTGMMDAVVVNAGCVPQTDNFIINFSVYGWNYDFSDPAIILDLYVSMQDDPFIWSDAHEFVKVNSQTGFGHYNHVIWNDLHNCYFAGGHSENSFGNNGVLDKILPDGTVAWTKTGMWEIQGIATNGDHVFITAAESSTIMALDAVTGDKVWETTEQGNAPWGWGVENLVYKDGYLYAAGRGGSMWSWQGIVVQRINPVDGMCEWSRLVHVMNDSINVSWNFFSQFLSVTDDSIYIACNGQFKTGANSCGGLIRLPLDGGPELEAIINPGFEVDSSFRIDGKFEGTPLSVGRVATTEYEISSRTDLEFITTDIQYNGDYTQNTGYPTIKTTITCLTSNSGVNFGDGTPRANHNPVDVAEVCADWNDSNQYTLQLSDRGKFIRTQWYYQDNIYINVPSDSQVNFPVGAVITLINMWDWNANGYSIYINAFNDNMGQRAHVYLAGQGPFPQNGGWSPQWKFQGRGTATLMKVGANEWLLTGNNISDSDY
jgi:hypothetical protein